MLITGERRLAGIVVLLVLCVLVVIGITKPNPFDDTYTYWAVFDDAQGLGKIDRDVRIAGVKVGSIGKVERTGDDVRTELRLTEDHVLHRDARVAMRPHTLFEGSNFVVLSPGSPSAPVLERGGTIPRRQTTNYVTLDKALRILRPEIRTRLRDLAEVGADTLRGEAVSGVQQTLRSAPGLTKSLGPAARAVQGPRRTELAGAITGLSRTARAVAEREDDLAPLVRGVSRTNAALTFDGGASLDAALRTLPPALRDLIDSAPTLTALVDRLDRLSVAITPGLPELGASFGELTPVLRRSIPVLRRSTPLIRDARLIARRLGLARDALVEMFGLLPRPLRLFEPALEQINAPTKHGAPAYRQLVAGGFTGLDASFRGFQTKEQNPGAPGHALRIGTYFGPGFATGISEGLPDILAELPAAQQRSKLPSCSLVAQVSPRAARALRNSGGCR